MLFFAAWSIRRIAIRVSSSFQLVQGRVIQFLVFFSSYLIRQDYVL
jgi:hypothetical protein